jgi:hypothetical protein
MWRQGMTCPRPHWSWPGGKMYTYTEVGPQLCLFGGQSYDITGQTCRQHLVRQKTSWFKVEPPLDPLESPSQNTGVYSWARETDPMQNKHMLKICRKCYRGGRLGSKREQGMRSQGPRSSIQSCFRASQGEVVDTRGGRMVLHTMHSLTPLEFSTQSTQNASFPHCL